MLKQKNIIHENHTLIILKYEKVNTSASDKNVQFEIYEQNTNKKIHLSLFYPNITVNLYIPHIFDEKTKDLYIGLNNSGYDLFNINNSFYQDICTPFKSENGTDVLLSDRIKDYYINKTSCQSNCKYSKYLLENNILKCECNIYTDIINVENSDKEKEKINLYKNHKNSNFKSLKCTS